MVIPVMMKSDVWLSTSSQSVESVSQKWFSIVRFRMGHCHQTGDTCPCHSPSQKYYCDTILTSEMSLSTQCSVILQIKLDLSRLVTGRVLSLYTFISGPKEVSGETRGDVGIFIWLDKYTRRLVISWQIIDKPQHRYFIDFRWII